MAPSSSSVRRPSPEALLARAVEEEGERRGRLKVFLGAAPGVGKTYAMLQGARELRRQGMDVVVGVVETHGRAETEALLEGLEVQARARLEYKGRVLEELDLDGLLRRRPRVALIDELAHRNAPGSRHERRYQDVEELLDAGIDVYATVNIQHLESLNDVVEQITGVRVRETVPDAFFDRLGDLVLVDLPPRELIERLRQGKVYLPDQARAALQSFFSPGNLAALRELAMQTAADRVETDLREYLTAHGAGQGVALRRRVLVAIDDHGHAEYLVRVARRLAERRQAPWTVAYVDTGGGRDDRASVDAAFQLAQRLGGSTVLLRGADVAAELIGYASRHGASSILIGRTRERRFARALGRTVTQRLLAAGARFDLTIVNTPFARVRSRRRLRGAAAWRAGLREYAAATAAAGAAVVGAWVLERAMPVPSLALVFVTVVVGVAARARRDVALYCALLSFLAYNFFFTEPRLTLRISSEADIAAVFAFLIAALICSHLAARLRSQVEALRVANQHTGALRSLGERLVKAVDETEVLRAGVEELATALGCDVVLLRRGEAEDAGLTVAARRPSSVALEARDLAAADWVAGHSQPAGRFTATLAASPWWFLPLVVESGSLGAAGLRFAPDQGPPSEELRRLAGAMIQEIALAADRARLAASLERAHVESETERLRTALLTSVSHDLRSPLASVIGAATSLSAYGEKLGPDDRRQLLEAIRSEGERLDRYIQNLLDMTRLGSGGLKLARDWVAVEDLVASAVTRLGKLFPSTPVETRIGGGLPLLYVHAALVEQALFNILENAAKFSPSGAPVVVTAASAGGRMVIEISDRGPGIPEAERRRIFDMFWSASRGDGDQRGTGLGLTIVRGMIGAHQGQVEARPGPDGRGTTIRVTLPLPDPPRPDATDEDA